MRRAIDHLVLCVHDLEEARRFYERLGFTLTPRAEHPFGTANHLAQLQGNFLEIVAIADAARIPPPQPRQFSFGAFNAAFLHARQGMSMLVFPSDDARRDQQDFAARGLGGYDLFEFSRKARLPGGGEATVSFSLAFATDPAMPEAAFFVCQQHAPQYFWKPDYQRHANRASAVVEVTMAAAQPERFADFFRRLLGGEAVAAVEGGLRMALEGADLLLLDPARLRQRFGSAVAIASGDGPRFAAYAVAVAELGALEGILRRNGVPFQRAGGRLRIAPGDAFGALVEFTAAP